MPATPTLWRDDYRVNINANGNQTDAVITQLASGYILVVWTEEDDSSAAGSPAGREVVGRIFNPLGDLVTSEFRLNKLSTLDDEFDPSITALSDGGFMVAYDRAGSFNRIQYETYSFNAATSLVAHENFGFMDHLDDSSFGGGIVASASASSTMTAFIRLEADGYTELYIRAYDPTSDTLSGPIRKTEFGGASGPEEHVTRPDICALSNGTYAVTYLHGGVADRLDFQIVNTAGTTLFSGNMASNADHASVAALHGGGFVVTWQDGSGALCRVYSNSGQALTSGLKLGSLNNFNQERRPDVAGLFDGDFVVVWVDATDDALLGQRYDAAGSKVGAEIVVEQLTDAAANEAAPQIAAFADGRFAVTWDDGADVRIKYFDIRDTVPGVGFYSPDQWQIGTAGEDTIAASASTESVRGWTGSDTITGSASGDDIWGDGGNDTLSGGAGDDSLIGGAGADHLTGGPGADVLNGGGPFIFAAETDTASYEGSNAAVTVDLGAGTGTGGHAQGDTLASIEFLVGSAFGDTLIGNGSANTLEGGAGNDTLSGGAGNDMLNGRTGADAMAGGAGNDRYWVDNVADTITESAGQGSDALFTSVTYTLAAGREIELFGTNLIAGTTAINLTGNAFGQRIDGNNGNNIIYGGAGDDLLVGYGGNDNIEGQNGADTLKGVSGADKFVFRYNSIATSGGDHISDFGADDAIYVDHPSVTGPLNPEAFVVGANALDANDRFIYYAPFDALYFDQDGNGAAAKVLMAVFDNGYVPSAADIILF